jgi:hypothetical protein
VELHDVLHLGADAALRGRCGCTFQSDVLRGAAKVERFPLELGGGRLTTASEPTDRREELRFRRGELEEDARVVGQVVSGSEGGNTGPWFS